MWMKIYRNNYKKVLFNTIYIFIEREELEK